MGVIANVGAVGLAGLVLGIAWKLLSPVEYIFVQLCLAVAFVFVLVHPVPQDKSYHDFADSRRMCCVPNAADVISNVPFLFVGVLGVYKTAAGSFINHNESNAWVVLFIAIALVSVGSAYYHWRPSNARLVWDRLPMTLGFMSLFIIVLEERLAFSLEYPGTFLPVLVLSLLIGAFSVALWSATDDLRLYIFVQFYPLVTLPFTLTLFSARYSHSYHLWYSFIWYIAAKLAELADKPIFSITQYTISGHTLKHLLAALGCYHIMIYLELREIL